MAAGRGGQAHSRPVGSRHRRHRGDLRHRGRGLTCLPVRMGISLVKVAKRTRPRLSAGLLRSFTRATRKAWTSWLCAVRLLSGSAAVDGAAVAWCAPIASPPSPGCWTTPPASGRRRHPRRTGRPEGGRGRARPLPRRRLATSARRADARHPEDSWGAAPSPITSLLFHLIWWGFLAVFLSVRAGVQLQFLLRRLRPPDMAAQAAPASKAPRVAVRGKLFMPARTQLLRPWRGRGAGSRRRRCHR